MNKQCDIFNGSALNPFDKHKLEKERKQKTMKKLLGDVEFVDGTKKPNLEIHERDFIRTCEEILQVKYKMRNFFVCTSIVSEKEVWVEDRAIKKSSKIFLDVLIEGDKLLFRNDNDILIEGYVKMVYQNKKKIYKIVVQDIKDGEVMCIEYKNIKRVLAVSKTERNTNVK